VDIVEPHVELVTLSVKVPIAFAQTLMLRDRDLSVSYEPGRPDDEVPNTGDWHTWSLRPERGHRYSIDWSY
jgi:hypothetical protein